VISKESRRIQSKLDKLRDTEKDVEDKFQEWCDARKEVVDEIKVKVENKEYDQFKPEIENHLKAEFESTIIKNSEKIVESIKQIVGPINIIHNDEDNLTINTKIFKERIPKKILDCEINPHIECKPIITNKEFKIDDEPVYIGDRYLKYNELSKLLVHLSKCIVTKQYNEAKEIALSVIENNKNAYYVKLLIYINKKLPFEDRVLSHVMDQPFSERIEQIT